MRLEVNGDALNAALAAGSQERKTTLPILTHALLEADAGRLRVTTTDLEAMSVDELDAKYDAPASVCADAALLRAAARSGKLVLHIDANGGLRAEPQGGSKMRIPTLPAKEFPVDSESRTWAAVDMPGTALARALHAVEYAAGVNDVRYYLNGVWLLPGMAAASDGHRCCIFETGYAGPNVCIPIAHVPKLVAMLGEEGARLSIGSASGQPRAVQVEANGRRFSARLIDGSPPDFRKVTNFASIEPVDAVFDRAKMLDGAKQFVPFTPPMGKTHTKGVMLAVGDGQAQLRNREDDCVENLNWALLSVEEPFEFYFEHSYLLDMLSALQSDKVMVSVERGRSDCRLRMQPVEGGGEVHVVMGLRR